MGKIDIELNMGNYNFDLDQMVKKDKAFNDFIKEDCSRISILKLSKESFLLRQE